MRSRRFAMDLSRVSLGRPEGIYHNVARVKPNP
jgi:hypothetical protein